MYIIFDIGGTNTRVAVSDDLVTFRSLIKFKTPLDYQEGIAAIKNSVSESIENATVLGVAGGIRGPLNEHKTGILSEVVLTDWVGRDITGDLAKAFGASAYLENDTAIVGLGEVHYGAAKGHKIVAYHTVSTGVGGARFVNGALDVARVGFEPGHQILDFDKSFLKNGENPTLENLVSGSALTRDRGCQPYEISQDDPVWTELAMRLAAGLRNTIVYWSPDVIVLGGSMVVGDPRIRLEDIRTYTEGIMSGFMPCPMIVDAQLGDDGGLYGAMALLKLRQK
jgi:predicted NBD/HSP70 family sugar kinase